MTDKLFDELVNEIREEEIPAEQVTAARERVWQRLAGSVSLACAEIRPQLTDYAAGRLMESRRLLVDDHLSRCVECRHALAELKGEKKVVVIPQRKSFRWTGWMRWAAAAAVILMVVYMGRGHFDSWLAPSGPSATIVSLSGDLYRLPQESLPVGSTLQKGDVIRTTRGGRAVLKLADGSRIELNERTELAVHTAWSGATIRLNRGDIMVQAAKQRRGNMRVITHDSIVSVKGTIFSVSSGAAGSLISVLEGSVAVSQSGKEEVLTPGRQSSTSHTLKQVAIEDAISWSQDAEKYHSLLADFIRIEEQLADIPGPALRTEAHLLTYIPAGTQEDPPHRQLGEEQELHGQRVLLRGHEPTSAGKLQAENSQRGEGRRHRLLDDRGPAQEQQGSRGGGVQEERGLDSQIRLHAEKAALLRSGRQPVQGAHGQECQTRQRRQKQIPHDAHGDGEHADQAAISVSDQESGTLPQCRRQLLHDQLY